MDLKDLNFSQDQSLLNFTSDSIIISAQLDTYQLKIEGIAKKKNERRPFFGPSLPNESKKDSVESPDKTHIAYIKNSNLYIKAKSTQEEIQMSFDGNNGFFYSSNIYWSPDNKRIIAYKLRPRQEHKVHYIETSPSDQLQPKLLSRDYLKPGDELDFKSPQLFNIETPSRSKNTEGEPSEFANMDAITSQGYFRNEILD